MDAYQQACEARHRRHRHAWAPWTIVPADSKTHRNLMIARAIVQTLEGLKLRYPPGSPELAAIHVE